MEDKYYKPTRDEFYLGFMYEGHRSIFLPSSKEEWLTLEFGRWTDPSSENNFKEALYNGGMRVKYLDRSDIESLGFKLIFNNDFIEKFTYTKDNLGFNDYTVFTLTKSSINPYIIIDFQDHNSWACNNGELFQGTIKNLSELKKVLKMLNIV